MTPTAGYPVYLFAIISNSIIFTLGMIASMGVPWFLYERLKKFSSTGRQLVSSDQNVLYTTHHSSGSFWDAAFAFQLVFSSTGYVVSVYYFWRELDSVPHAVFQSTITILGISVGVTLSAAAVIHFMKSVGWMD
jgi:hypothetical protein